MITLEQLNKSINSILTPVEGIANFQNLLFELFKPTIEQQSETYINPDFQTILPYLINDIYTTTKLMEDQSGIDPLQSLNILVDPDCYDEEIGNYVDTTLSEFIDFGWEDKPIEIDSYMEDMPKFLQENIDNHKDMIIQEVQKLIEKEQQ